MCGLTIWSEMDCIYCIHVENIFKSYFFVPVNESQFMQGGKSRN